MNDELKNIIVKMLEAGETEEDIKLVIQNFEAISKKKSPEEGLDSEQGLADQSGDGFQSPSSDDGLQSPPSDDSQELPSFNSTTADPFPLTTHLQGVTNRLDSARLAKGRIAIAEDPLLQSIGRSLIFENPNASEEELSELFDSDPFFVHRRNEVVSPIEKEADDEYNKELDKIRESVDSGDIANAFKRGQLNREMNKLLGVISGQPVFGEPTSTNSLGVERPNLRQATDKEKEEAIKGIYEISNLTSLIPQSEAKAMLEDMVSSENLSFGEKIQNIAIISNAFGAAKSLAVLAELQTESLASAPEALAMSIAGGGIGRAGLIIGGLIGTFSAEEANSVAEAFANAGVDITKPNEIREVFNDPEKQQEIRSNVLKRAGALSAVDALFNVATVGLGKLGKFGKAASVPTQVLSEGVSEGSGQLAGGGDLDAGGIIMEMLSSTAQSSAEAGMLVAGSTRKYSINGQRLTNRPRNTVSKLIEQATSTEELEGLSIENDRPLENKLRKKINELQSPQSDESNTTKVSETDGQEAGAVGEEDTKVTKEQTEQPDAAQETGAVGEEDTKVTKEQAEQPESVNIQAAIDESIDAVHEEIETQKRIGVRDTILEVAELVGNQTGKTKEEVISEMSNKGELTGLVKSISTESKIIEVGGAGTNFATENETQRTVIDNATQTKKALVSSGITTKIKIHTNEDTFIAAGGESNRGIFTVDKGDGEIHINLKSATPNTPYHEAAHAVFNTALQLDPEQRNTTANTVRSILDEEASAQLDEFAKSYEGDQQSTEFLTEFLGRVANNEIKLDTSNISAWQKIADKIIDTVNTFTKSTFGEEVFTKKYDLSNAQDVTRMFAGIAKGLTAGKDINVNKKSVAGGGKVVEAAVSAQKTAPKKPDPKKTTQKKPVPKKEPKSKITAKELKSRGITAADKIKVVKDNQNTIAKFLMDDINELSKKGFSKAEVRQVANKIKTAPQTERGYIAAATRASDMINRISHKATYDEAKALRRKAKKTFTKKAIGVEGKMKRLLKVDPVLVPNELIDQYVATLRSLTSRKLIPSGQTLSDLKSLDEINQILENAELENIMDISQLAQQVEEAIFENPEQLSLKDKKAVIKEVLKGMQAQGMIIDEADYRRVSDQLNQKWSLIKKALEKPVDPISVKENNENFDEVISTIQEIKANLKDVMDGLSHEQKVILHSLIKATDSDFTGLSRTELNNLKDGLFSVLNGWWPRKINSLNTKIKARRNFNNLKDKVAFLQSADLINVTPPERRDKSGKVKSREQLFKEMITWHAQNIEFVLGKIPDNIVYKTLINPLSRGVTQAQHHSNSIHEAVKKLFLRAVDRMNDKQHKGMAEVSKAQKFNTVLSMVLTEREWIKNADDQGVKVHKVDDHLQAIEEKQKKGMYPTDLRDYYREIKKEFSTPDGAFDYSKALSFVNKYGGDGIIAFMDSQIENEYTEKARFVSNTLKDKAFLSLNKYFPKNAIGVNAIESQTDINKLLEGKGPDFEGASITSSHIQDRGNTASAITFDAFNSFVGMAHTLEMQWRVQQPLDEANATLGIMINEGDERTRQTALALRDFIKASFVVELGAMRDIDLQGRSPLARQIMQDTMKRITGQTLASVPRLGAEYASNIGAIGLKSDPEVAKKVFGYGRTDLDRKNLKRMAPFAGRFGTAQTKRGLSKDEDVRVGDIWDKMLREPHKKNTAAKWYVNQLKNSKLGTVATAVNKVNQKAVEAPDKAVASDLWYFSVAHEFKRLTGQPIDFEKIETDSNYAAAYHDEISQSIAFGDKETSFVVNTGSAFEQPLADRIAKRTAMGKATRWLKGFQTNEAGVFRDVVLSLSGKGGTLTKARASRMLVGQIFQQMSYQIFKQGVYAGVFSIADRLFDTDLQDEDDYNLGALATRGSVDMAFTNVLGHWPVQYKLAMSFALNMAMKHAFKANPETVDDIIYSPVLSNRSSDMVRQFGVAGTLLSDGYNYYNQATRKRDNTPWDNASLALTLIKDVGVFPFYQDAARVVREFKKEEKEGVKGDFDPFKDGLIKPFNMDIDIGLEGTL